MLSFEDKKNIIYSSLDAISIQGWTFSALDTAATEMGIALADVKIAFDASEKNILIFYSHCIDQEMLDHMHASPNFSELKIHEKVRLGLVKRLELLNPHKTANIKFADFLKHPKFASLGPKLIYDTVNEIWYAAGDQSTDFNFYTKRAILSGIYSSTMVYWLKSQDEDLSQSYAFMDKRFQDSAKIPKLKKELESTANLILAPVKKLFEGFKK